MEKKTKEFTLQIGERTLSASFENLAEKANGEVMLRYGDTVVFATVTMSDEEIDKGFFPLSVNYEEKFYAAGKISGSRYTRREGKPSDRATLISRMIDRAIRPKFPSEMKREVQVIITCLSWDEENDPGVLGMIAASTALHISDIPWKGPLGAVRLAKEEDYILNPNYEARTKKKMDVVISGFIGEEKNLVVNMIEGFFKEEDEDSVMGAFRFSSSPIAELCAFQEKIRKSIGKEKIEVSSSLEDKDIEEKIKEKSEKQLEKIFQEENKEEKLEKLKKEISKLIEENYEEKNADYAFSCLEENIKKKVRESVLKKDTRIDGRKLDEVRKIDCSVGILPRTHGSSLFKRGQTKALSIITLGAPGEEQLMDDMELSEKKRFMHHYNFPPYSVGEIRPVRGPGRREIGHGMLAENAISPLIPEAEIFPYTIRGVSEIVSSNGSTSMASVCATTLSLMDAGVPIKKPAAGISIGLVTGDKKEYKLLTDIQGPEDHYGDMDFKVAGTEDGITAIQMDVKIDGVTEKMISETLQRAKKTRLYLIEKIKEVIPAPREELSPYAPRIKTLKIDSEKIGDVIGPKGKTINEIIEKTNVAIDIDDSGLISIASEKEENIEKAVNWIKNITREIKEGEIFEGRVIKLFNFGAVVEILPGQEGLVHISEIDDRRVESVESELEVGQIVRVKVIKVDSNGKTSLSIKKAKE